MGIDFHAFNFLRYSASKGAFGRTITIGRQELVINSVALSRLVQPSSTYEPSPYCDNILVDQFGATTVDSIDNCEYEGASHILDLCRPVPIYMHGSYDTVIDAGTTEHIYNAPQALRSMSELVSPGGQVIHILPANNYCGHGFWQFSPELFFSLYTEKNGYRDTEVFLADFINKWRWFRVSAPRDGQRVNVASFGELYVMVRSVRTGENFSHDDVQQSDYIHEWQTRKSEPEPFAEPTGLRSKVMSWPLLYDTLFPLYHRWQRLRSPERMTSRNPGLQAFDVRGLVGSNVPVRASGQHG